MINDQAYQEFMQKKDLFEIFEKITYKNIYINNTIIRILGILYMDCSPDWNIKKHKHPFFELHYVIKNSAFTTIRDVERKIEPGFFYLMPPGTFHSHRQRNDGHIGFAIRWEFITNAEGFPSEAYFEQINTKDILDQAHTSPIKDDGTIINDMTRLLKEAEMRSTLLELQLILLQLVMHLSRFYSDILDEENPQKSRQFFDNHMVNAAIRFIEENYQQVIDVNDIAHSVHISYSHLSRLFKDYTGETINNYLIKTRIKQSQYLLKCTNKSIGLISNATGFSSEFYFSSIFKKHTGMSPGQYRRNHPDLLE